MGTRALHVAVIAIAAACGNSGNGGSADGGGGGGGDAAPGGDVVTAIIDNSGVPVAGARVVFQNADSSVAAEVMTDASGRASAHVEAGGYVTAVNPFGGVLVVPDVIDTVGDVAPGDQLVFHYHSILNTPIRFPLTVPLSPGATLYTIAMTCDGLGVIDVGSGGSDTLGSDSATGTGQVNHCPSGIADMLVLPSEQQVALVARDVAIGSGVPVTITGAYEPFGSATISVTGVPAGIADLAFEYAVSTPRGGLYGVETFDGSAMVVGGAQSVTVAVPAGEFTYQDTELPDPETTTLDAAEAIGWGSSSAAPVSHDVSGLALPRFTSVPVYDAASHAVTWQATAGAATPTLGYASVLATRSGHQWVWSISEPYTAGAVAFPKLPADTFDYNIGAADAGSATYAAVLAVPPDIEPAVRGGMFASDDPDDVLAGIAAGSAGQVFVVACDSTRRCK
jgi:hypothetical protein